MREQKRGYMEEECSEKKEAQTWSSGIKRQQAEMPLELFKHSHHVLTVS
jgi:hypothetical protein